MTTNLATRTFLGVAGSGIDVKEGVIIVQDIFTGDIFEEIQPPHGVSFKLVGTALPANQDIYFVAKWHEIFERYSTARLFVRKALEDNWDYWFNKVDDEKIQHAIENKFKAELYDNSTEGKPCLYS